MEPQYGRRRVALEDWSSCLACGWTTVILTTTFGRERMKCELQIRTPETAVSCWVLDLCSMALGNPVTWVIAMWKEDIPGQVCVPNNWEVAKIQVPLLLRKLLSICAQAMITTLSSVTWDQNTALTFAGPRKPRVGVFTVSVNDSPAWSRNTSCWVSDKDNSLIGRLPQRRGASTGGSNIPQKGKLKKKKCQVQPLTIQNRKNHLEPN